MDNITHAALGAAIGEAVLGKKLGNKAAIIGALVANIPDLDLVLLPFYSGVERIGIHRGYSHSIILSLALALLISYFISRKNWAKEVGFYKILMLNWLVLLSHIFLDSFTTYGTQLFLPFSDYRVSIDSINIIDPVFTFPVLIGVSTALFLNKNNDNRRIYNYIGLGVSILYLLTTLGIKKHVNNQFRHELAEQNITFNKLLSVPVGMASLKWYGVAKSKDSLYIGKLSDIQHNHVSFEAFPVNDALLEGLDPWLVNRLKWFAQGYYTVAEDNGKIRVYNMQCDMQGVRHYGDYKAPTAFYYEVTPKENGGYDLTSGMQPNEANNAKQE